MYEPTRSRSLDMRRLYCFFPPTGATRTNEKKTVPLCSFNATRLTNSEAYIPLAAFEQVIYLGNWSVMVLGERSAST